MLVKKATDTIAAEKSKLARYRSIRGRTCSRNSFFMEMRTTMLPAAIKERIAPIRPNTSGPLSAMRTYVEPRTAVIEMIEDVVQPYQCYAHANNNKTFE